AHLIDASFDLAHSVANAPAVRLQFLFARATNTDAPRPSAGSACPSSAALAAKARHRSALSCQPRQHIVSLRQFPLQLAFTAALVPRKDVENQLRPVDHSPLGGLFDVALLHRAEVAVENNQSRLVRRRLRADFFELAAADERRGIGGVAQL